MFFLPCKGGTFASEVNKGASNRRVIFDPNLHIACNAKKGADVRKVLAVGPIADLGNF